MGGKTFYIVTVAAGVPVAGFVLLPAFGKAVDMRALRF